QDSFGFGGNWNITPENATTGKNATLSYHFFANKVFLVIRPGGNTNPTIKVYVDNKLVDDSSGGADVKDGIATVDTDRLYNLVDLKGKAGSHTLRLEFQSPGVQVFAFTFG
ncbi:MAG TPA: hypothetical protein VN711_01470, partial [Candidatus Saccharimonadales bacterium]|nr:hypothetical protein [Candidatus Saccharimonadales bacterium]